MKMDDEAAEGDLHGRAMPVLDQDDVDALARAVQPILDSDEAVRRWCTRANVERFPRADRGNLAKATKRLTDTLKWRVVERPETRVCSACINKDLRSHYMNFVGWDRRGRALVYSDIGLAKDKTPEHERGALHAGAGAPGTQPAAVPERSVRVGRGLSPVQRVRHESRRRQRVPWAVCSIVPGEAGGA